LQFSFESVKQIRWRLDNAVLVAYETQQSRKFQVGQFIDSIRYVLASIFHGFNNRPVRSGCNPSMSLKIPEPVGSIDAPAVAGGRSMEVCAMLY